MKLLRHYVSDVAHMKVRPIAELRSRLRRQPNTCAWWDAPLARCSGQMLWRNALFQIGGLELPSGGKFQKKMGRHSHLELALGEALIYIYPSSSPDSHVLKLNLGDEILHSLTHGAHQAPGEAAAGNNTTQPELTSVLVFVLLGLSVGSISFCRFYFSFV